MTEYTIIPLEDSFLVEESEWLLQWTKLNSENCDDGANKSDAEMTEYTIIPLEDSFLVEESEWLLQWTKLNSENCDDGANKSDAKHSNLMFHLKEVKIYREQIDELNSEHAFLNKEMELVRDLEKQKCDLQLYNAQKENLTIERDGLLLQLEEAKEKYASILQKLDGQSKSMVEMNKNFHLEIEEFEQRQIDMLHAIQLQDEKHLLQVDMLERNLQNKYSEVNVERNLQNKYSEVNVCGICVTPWDSGGVHRLVSLPCGHLFGDKCIREHLRRVLQCPICKVMASEEHLRYIYGINILPYEN
ncbi:protein kinase C and casein kinase substrate in neurons protein 2-like isoform X1 [Drosophila pseudoobscura]|uniref:Protein kinase C and casein kinase substrate in neurons protein 2-like isoform X1 n=2 Tax=Drosophila pseudoobscura pseudoobscura TaxID=46245 RepID=A0A6I8UXV3_DROPS|nr:protein kinase C and casein kinase substrate in neurons protein 2 isoform X1 [Drosophila pseudoobscura]XP_033236272.1 protein kinase C and casein kinase substrate in neurons protein 2 isoform X1 [Drosophila pseudoobscura]